MIFNNYATRLCSNNAKSVMTSLRLYKHLLRECEKLPPKACSHYKFAVKQVNNLCQ